MASPSWRLKVSGGRPRVGGGGRSGGGGSGHPGGRGADGAVSGGRGAGRGGAGVPTASREASGRSGAAGAPDSRSGSGSALAEPAASARGPVRVGVAGTLRAAASSWRRPRGSRAVLQTPRDGLGSRDRGVYCTPFHDLAPANHPPAVPAFSPKWDSSLPSQPQPSSLLAPELVLDCTQRSPPFPLLFAVGGARKFAWRLTSSSGFFLNTQTAFFLSTTMRGKYILTSTHS